MPDSNTPVPSRPLLEPQVVAPYLPRRFVPAETSLGDSAGVTRLYQQLIDRPVNTANDALNFMVDRGELEGALDQYGSLLYIAMTCQTDDSHRSISYRNFIEQVEPAVKPLEDTLNRKTLELAARFSLTQSYYSIYLRNLNADAQLFRPENVDLQRQEAILKQDYQTLNGAMTVTFREKEYTLPQMAVFLQDSDRTTRQAAWHAQAQRRTLEAGKMTAMFDQLGALRTQIARNAGCAGYREYKFIEFHRFDYTPQQCRQFQQAVLQHVVPVYKDILRQRRQQMGLTALRPWDLDADPAGLPALKPFTEINQLINGVQRIFNRMDSELADQFQLLDRQGLLDLASRKGKAPGGYQCSLAEARKPFIFMNAVGADRDLITLLHEAGHAFHALACRDQALLTYRHAPMEFCEVASMSMELLGRNYLNEFYHQQDLIRFQRKQLQNIVQLLCWIATIDAFQHWLYENPGHTPQQRTEFWLQLHEDFIGHSVDWSSLEPYRVNLWHQQLHIFQYPFYYIEYGIAQLGALGIWQQALLNEPAALANYKKALALGGSVPLPDLFTAAGLTFDFSDKTIQPQMDSIRRELELF